MKWKLVLLGGGVFATILLSVGVALATAPVRGALYTGGYSSGTTLSFQVSANGKQVTNFTTGYPGPICSAPPPVPAQHARIHNGRFTVRIGSGWTVTGRFLAHGNVKGTWTYTEDCEFPVKVVKHFHGTWSAGSEPDGAASRNCSDYVKPTTKFHGIELTSIVAFHVSCNDVDKALKAGTFAAATPFTFTTPGWTCRETKLPPLPRFSCARGHASFRFTKFD
jgi:hypothetical protein